MTQRARAAACGLLIVSIVTLLMMDKLFSHYQRLDSVILICKDWTCMTGLSPPVICSILYYVSAIPIVIIPLAMVMGSVAVH